MHSVARGLIVPIVDWARANGHPCTGIFTGLGFDEDDLRTGMRRLPWTAYLAVHDRLARELGGVEALSALIERLPTPSLDWLLRSLDRPIQIYRMWSHMAPLLWGALRLEVDELPDGTIAISARLPEGSPDATLWFTTCTGAIAAMVERIDLPRADVTAVRITPHAADWVVRAPTRTAAPDAAVHHPALAHLSDMGAAYADAMRELADARQRLTEATAGLANAGALFILDTQHAVAWTNDAGRAWLAATSEAAPRLTAAAKGASDPLLHAVPLQQPAGHHLVILQDANRDFEDRIQAASAAWQLTPAQAHVLRGVVRGLSNKEIAATLGNAEATVEVHVTRVLRKAGAAGRTVLVTRFWGGSRAG